MAKNKLRMGYRFEVESSELGGERGRRVLKSGAIGSITGFPAFIGDYQFDFPWLSKKITGEAKHGYGGAKQIAVKKEWYDKIQLQAKSVNMYDCVSFKFKNACDGVTRVISFDFETFKKILDDIDNIYEENTWLKEENEKLRK